MILFYTIVTLLQVIFIWIKYLGKSNSFISKYFTKYLNDFTEDKKLPYFNDLNLYYLF